jgi:hypothetical protein
MWQPIETAPRDETWVIGWAEGFDRPIPMAWVDDTAKYHSGEVGWCYGDTRWGGILYEGINLAKKQPTHWQPLPDPPLHKANSLAIT